MNSMRSSIKTITQARPQHLSPGSQTALVALVTAILAGIVRLIGLASLTPGFRTEEATSALMARRVNQDNLPVFFGHEQDALPPFLPYAVKLTGSLTGWGVNGPRLATAICGIFVAVSVALWLARVLGPVWGLIGGTLAATSFWHIMFSRQAIAPISTALFVGLGLWLAWIALEHGVHQQPDRFYQRTDLLWYILAGAVFGLGFLTDASYVIVPPLVLLTAGILALHQLRSRRDGDALGPAMLILALVVAMTPLAGHFLDNPDDFRRSMDLAAELPEVLADTGSDVVAGLRGLVWRGTDDPALNLPERPISDPILVIWGILGLLAALRYPIRAFEGTLLIWAAVGIFAISLIGGDDPSLYFPLAPILTALPVLGMHGVWRLVRHRQSTLRIIVGMLIGVSAIASAGWSIYDYFWQWSDSTEAYVAMRGDVRDAIEAVDNVPEDDIPAYFVVGDAERIARYLAPDRLHHLITGRDQISIPAASDAYLIAPRSAGPVPQLRAFLVDAELIDVGDEHNGRSAYRIWLVGPRSRDELPYAAPSIPFANGWSLAGFDARASVVTVGAQPAVDVVMLWQAPQDADPFTAEVRLRPKGASAPDGPTTTQVKVVPWKTPGVTGGEYLLVYSRVMFPGSTDLVASLEVGLRNPATGELVIPLLNRQDSGYTFFNDLQIILP